MGQYRKNVIIEATQFLPSEGIWPEGILSWDSTDIHPQPRDGSWGYIETLEGPLHVQSGDWIITGIQGEKYPCKPDIFLATYEAVQEEAASARREEKE